MSKTWRRTTVVGGLGVYLVSLGFFGGIVVERIRFDRQRTTVVQRHEAAVRRVHDQLMALERSGPTALDGVPMATDADRGRD